MFRIDHVTRALALFGVGKDGFTEGNPSTATPATRVTGDFLNALQEELANAVERYMPLRKATKTQLLSALGAIREAMYIGLMASRYAASELNDACSDDSKTIVFVHGAGATNRVFSSIDGGASYVGRSAGSVGLRRVAWSKPLALFCAVGESGVIYTSPTGVTWSLRTSGTVANLNALVWSAAHGLFVAVGDSGKIVTSPDGITWTVRTPAGGVTDPFYAVSVTGSTLIVGGTNHLQYSLNGIAWVEATFTGGIWVTNFMRTPSGIYTGDAGGYAARLSTDGITWIAVTPATWMGVGPALGAGYYEGGDCWVSGGSPSKIAYDFEGPAFPLRQDLSLYARTPLAWVGSGNNNVFVSPIISC